MISEVCLMIDMHSGTPLYQQLTVLLRDKIQAGEFKVGNRIPSEAELGAMFGISRITVRQALADLERDGLLEKIPGKGTFVKNVAKIKGLTRLSSFSEATAASGQEAGYFMVRIRHDAYSKEAAQVLQSSDKSFFMVKRVLLANGSPVGMHTSYLPKWLIEQAPDDLFTEETLGKRSLHNTIEKTGVELYRAEEIVEPALAGKEESDHLGMKRGDLILQVKRTIFDKSGRPLTFEIDTYRPDAYTYRIEIYRNR
jgi:GntR family transcriptional regulator